MAEQFVMSVHRLTKAYPPSRTVIDNMTLSFFPGAKIGVIGANGQGKSTLLRILAGVDTEYGGTVWRAPGVRVGYLPQEPRLDPGLTVQENVELGVRPIRDLLEKYNALNARLCEPLDDDAMQKVLDEVAAVQDAIEACDAWEIDSKVALAMDALRLPPADADVASLSGGEQRRVALCRLLLEQPDVLLLDEPTNHLDALTVAWLEHHLREYPGTVICVTHDRYFLDNVAGWILEIDRGRGIPWEGNYSSWLEQKQQRMAEEQRHSEARRKLIERELAWIRMNPAAKRTRNKARIARYQQLLEEDAKAPRTASVPHIVIPAGPRLGNDVVVAEKVTKGYGDRLLFSDLSFRLPPGGIVGVIGPNGAGKTTLFRLIVGQEQPDAGTIKLGDTVQLAYVDQTRDALHPDHTVFEEISGGEDVIRVGGREWNARAYVAAFQFTGTDQQKRVGDLSGGERNRVHLAKLLRTGGNLLLLDEPTNDLDVHTLRALEEALASFAGCAVIISHDRWFLDRVATHILAFEGDSEVVWFEGNFEAYEEDLRRRKGVDSTVPTRVRYRKFSR